MRSWRAVGVVLAVAGLVVGGSATAVAAPPETSSVTVSSAVLQPGETFTVTQEVFNPESFTVTDANASIAGLGDLVELVSCTGAVCGPYFTSFRGYVGDLDGGQARTVVFTLRVRDDAGGGVVEWSNQLVGSNYAFASVPSPALTIVAPAVDLGVGLRVTPVGLIAPRLDYTATVTNLGTGAVSGVRVAVTLAPGLGWAGGDCTRVGTTRVAHCEVATLGAGRTAEFRFAATTGLLTLGPFTTTAERIASTPADPAPGNDRAARTCTALTGLLVGC